ncbi:MAG: ABC transporter permease [Termitinemataceae bacterium]|nr:MAG: ABC transporter permease [Termitinemataceae bacterium]
MNDDEKWDRIITPKNNLFDLQIREIIRYRELILLFIKRDLNTIYKQTILGPLWFIINPLFSTAIYIFVFGNLAKMGTDGVPQILFYYSGTMLWTYFSCCFNDASNIFVVNSGVFGKVYFPRLTAPLSRIVFNLVTALIQFATLICFYIYYLLTGTTSSHATKLVLALPLIFMWISFLATGTGLFVSALTTKYRDLRQLVGFGLNLLMYATPIVYPLSQASQKYRWILYMNPLSAPVELFRIALFGAGYVPNNMILLSVCMTIVLFFLGLITFNKFERTFIDVI